MEAKEVLKLLKSNGFSEVSQRGSHLKLTSGDKIVIVPIHGAKDIPIGTLKNIEKQSGIPLR